LKENQVKNLVDCDRLTIWLGNNKIYWVLFDKGLDFPGQNFDGTYQIKEAIYIVIKKIRTNFDTVINQVKMV
jgi:hypothetical protein